MTKIELGDKVRDPISGFEGIAIGRTEWLYGCSRVGVKPMQVNSDGKTVEPEWFDEPQLVLVSAGAHRPAAIAVQASPGGPRRDPSQVRPGERR